MITTIFRLGPLVILEWSFLISAAAISIITSLAPCYAYTLGYLALVTFLIEMIVSLRMMKTQGSIRREHLWKRVMESQLKYYARLTWDNLIFLLVIMLLYYSLVVDGLSLYSLQQKQSVEGSENGFGCDFTLFALCLFSQLQTHRESQIDEDLMVMWLLYCVSAFLTSIVCVAFSKEYYQYSNSLCSNRKLVRQFGSINETLLDCNVYSLDTTTVSDKLRDQAGTCPICLEQMLQKNEQREQLIRLRCQHLFHKACIDKWLEVKDHCPFRCFT